MGDRHARELCRTLGEAGDTLPFSKLDATVRYGTVRAGHGLQINLTGRVSDDPSQTLPFRNSKWWWRNFNIRKFRVCRKKRSYYISRSLWIWVLFKRRSYF